MDQPGCPVHDCTDDGTCVRFTIPGNPFPKERPRVGRGRMYTPKQTEEYEAVVKAAWPTSIPYFTVPVRVDLWFEREDARSADIDNLVKIILDGLNGYRTKDKTTKKFTTHPGVAYEDDKLVQEVKAQLVRKVGPGNGMTYVHIRALTAHEYDQPGDWWNDEDLAEDRAAA